MPVLALPDERRQPVGQGWGLHRDEWHPVVDVVALGQLRLAAERALDYRVDVRVTEAVSESRWLLRHDHVDVASGLPKGQRRDTVGDRASGCASGTNFPDKSATIQSVACAHL